MRKITLLFFTILSTVFYGQDKLTSSLSEFKVDGVFQNSNRTTYVYDANNNLIEENEFFWNSPTDTWVLSNKDEYVYNINNRVVTLISTSYNNEEVNSQYRTIHTYNNEGNLIITADEQLENNVWVNEERFEFTYVNNRLDFGLETEFINNEWVANEDDGKFQLIYDDNGRIVRFENLTGVNGNPAIEDERTLYSYDVNNRLVLSESQTWNGTSWVNDYKLEYSYDVNGNVVNFKETSLGEDSTAIHEDVFTFDTTELISNFAHPFKDKTGITYLLDPLGIVNKITSETSGSGDFRTTYFYGNEPSLSTKTDKVLVLKLYPNPTTDLVTVSGSNVSIKNIEVFNVLGKKIKTVTTNVISLKELVAGVYVLKIRTIDGKIVVKRVLKN